VVEEIIGDTDELIEQHLAPAHAEALDAAREHGHLAPLADDVAVRAAPTPKQRAGVDALALAAARYRSTRAAHTALTRRLPRLDVDGVLAELADLPDVWPTYRQHGQDEPWPVSRVARPCWIAVHARPWLPTVAEWDERWLEVFGEPVEQARRNRQQMTALGSVFG
jgi:hypothetical protein